MEIACQVNTQGFEAACLALSRISGQSIQQVVESELAKVLDRAIELTPAARASNIRQYHEASEVSAQLPSLYTPRHGRKNVTLTKNGKIKYWLANRYPDQLWAAIAQRRKESLLRTLRAIGLAKRSFWSIGQALGLPVKGGRFVDAVATTGKEYPENISVSKSVTPQEIAIAFVNSQPTVNLPSVNGRGALQSAINGRVKFFLVNVKLGVFDSLDRIASRYPGLKVRPGS